MNIYILVLGFHQEDTQLRVAFHNTFCNQDGETAFFIFSREKASRNRPELNSYQQIIIP